MLALIMELLVHAALSQLVVCAATGSLDDKRIAWSFTNDGATFQDGLSFDTSKFWNGYGIALQDDASVPPDQQLWVAVGGAGSSNRTQLDDEDPFVSRSRDGRAWEIVNTTRSTFPLTGRLLAVIYCTADSVFVSVGCCGPSSAFRTGSFTLMSSPDGITWTGVGT